MREGLVIESPETKPRFGAVHRANRGRSRDRVRLLFVALRTTVPGRQYSREPPDPECQKMIDDKARERNLPERSASSIASPHKSICPRNLETCRQGRAVVRQAVRRTELPTMYVIISKSNAADRTLFHQQPRNGQLRFLQHQMPFEPSRPRSIHPRPLRSFIICRSPIRGFLAGYSGV